MAEFKQNPRFSIIVPAYNEERRLPVSLRDMRSFFGPPPLSAAFAPALAPTAPPLPAAAAPSAARASAQALAGGSPLVEGAPPVERLAAPDFEALAVIELSRDRTLELAREATAGDPRFQAIDNKVHRGKGYAVRCGMLRARGDIVFFMDADLSTPLAEVLAFLAHFAAHPETDVLIGSRALAKSKVLKKQTWIRQNMGRVFNRFVQVFGIKGITDTQCGFKAFRAGPCREIFSRSTIDGFAFDVEALVLAEKLGYRIDVLPVRWVNSPDSKVRIWIDPLKMLRDLIRIRWIVRRTLRAKPPAKAGPRSS
jgi:dolichyl-phosphate beta-glucosyltransferase